MYFGRAVALAALTVFVGGCQEKKQEAPTAAAPAAEKKAESAPAAAPAGDKIVIGHVASMTGEQATFGDSTDKGIRLAIEEQNKKGGVKGKQVEVKTLDDQGKPEEAAVAATRLITDQKVALLLGEVASSRSLAIAPIADQNKIPMISPSSTNPRVTKDGQKTRPFVFRVCFIDPFQGTVMAKFAIENLKVKNVAVLRDVGNDYSVGLADFFSAKLKELGGKVVADQSYKAGDQDFKAQLTAIKNTKPEAIFVPGYYTDVALIGRQARELGMKVPLLGGDGWDSAKLYEIAQGALDGSYFSNHYTHENPAPVIQDFVKKYKEKYGDTPDALAAMGYDAAKVALVSMEKAKDLTGPSIAEAIAATKSYEAVTGNITINEDHNAVKSAVVLGIEKNAAKYKTTIAP
jgi:branched-chain amino acid transport system substrate-binding protein